MRWIGSCIREREREETGSYIKREREKECYLNVRTAEEM